MLSPRTSVGYAASTLFYTFTLGMVTASFTGLVLAIIGGHRRGDEDQPLLRAQYPVQPGMLVSPAGRTTRGPPTGCC
jgi:hypothetical protein